MGELNPAQKRGNAAALLPILVFLVLYLGCGLLFEYGLKIEMGFYQTPAIVAFPHRPVRSLRPEPGPGLQRQAEGNGQRGGG